MQEHALAVATLLVSKPCGTVLGSAKLRFEYAIAVHRAVDSLDASGRIVLLLKGHVDTKRLRLAIRSFAIANRNLLDVTILAEEFRPPQRLQELVFGNRRRKTCHVNQVLLDYADADQVLAISLVDLALLHFLLTLFSRSLLLVLLDIRPELRNPAPSLLVMVCRRDGLGGANSSCVTTFHCMVFSSYGRRQAGHRPLRLFFRLLKQNWQIYGTDVSMIPGCRNPWGGHFIPDIRKDTV